MTITTNIDDLIDAAGKGEYWRRGEALQTIRSLCAERGINFNELCKTRLQITYEQARLLIIAGQIRAQLAPTTPRYLPAHEAHCRVLRGLDHAELVRVWSVVCETFPASAVTVDDIQAVIDKAQINPDRAFKMLTRADVPDVRWPSNNPFDVPMLLLSGQGGYPELPFLPWGSQSRKRSTALTWHFYTDDSRFNALWADPTAVINSQCLAACEINFSIYDQTPRAVALHRVYMKRWIARYWQECGIKILVDLNVAEGYIEDNLLGVPNGWRSYSTRGYTDRKDQLANEYDLACKRARTSDIVFVVYGGGQQVKELSSRRGWMWYPEYMDQIKKGVADG